jgi:aspartate-semialdehyde dehydrogenase
VKLAVLGATGAVGRTMLEVLAERALPVEELVLLASARSVGATVAFGGRDWLVREPSEAAFAGCDIALFSAGAARSRVWGPAAAAAGAAVVDNSSAWRMDVDVPLVVPEVNPHAIQSRPRGIIANPNCATIQVVVPLEALRRIAGLRRVVITTFHSVSGAGNKGLAALDAESHGDETPTDSPFVRRIAGNVVPWIGPRLPTGWNEEEEKIRQETRKILELPDLRVTATCVRVPVRVGHAASVTAELDRAVSRAQLHDALASMTGVSVYGDEADPTPIDVAGTDGIRVGRLRIDPDDPRVAHFWVVADNLRKGAATNAVQIAERVLHGR